MKNLKKIICLVLTVLICFSLSGCNVIDRMRNSQIHYNKNQNLVYKNKVYKLLPDCEAFAPNMENREFLYVTDKDVPVLLSRIIGNEANITEDKKFITFEDKNYIPQYYAREDLYDDIATRINSKDYFDGYSFCHEYCDKDYNWYSKHVMISEEAKNALDKIISSSKPEDVDIELMYPYHIMELYSSSKDFYFIKYFASIYKTKENIYIGCEYSEDNTKVYKVGDKYVDAIQKLIDQYQTLQENNTGEQME